MLRGDTSDLPPALSRLSTTGLLRDETAHGFHGWIDACVAAALVVVSKDQYRTLSLTPEGRDVMRGQTRHVKLSRPVSLRHRSSFLDEEDDDDDDFDDGRFRRLLALRGWGGADERVDLSSRILIRFSRVPVEVTHSISCGHRAV